MVYVSKKAKFFTFTLEQWNPWISRGFQAPTGAKPALERKQNLSLTTPLELAFKNLAFDYW